MPSKTLKITGLAAAMLVAAGTIGALSLSTADAAARAERQVTAKPFNNPALAQRAGFPASALNVNITPDGKLSWMMSKAEQKTLAGYTSNYLRPAQRKIAAGLSDGLANTTSSLFGVSDTSTEMINGLEFEAARETAKLSKYAYYSEVRSDEEDDEIWAPLHLPAGAIVTGMTAYGYDESAADSPDFYLLRNCNGAYNGSGVAPQAHTTLGFAGGSYAVTSATSDLVIDNSDCTYSIEADTSEGTTDTSQFVYGVALRWKRQVSPDTATATFLDVPVGAPFHREIEALASSGITAGCNGGKFCPGNPVTRGQMAAFLARGLGLHWENN